MGYPGSVATFGTKNAGDTIQPADVNGLQTEVTAIENGLLGGFPHPIIVSVGGITQSASTGSNNFAGPSTFTGDVVMTGSLTVGGVAVGGNTAAVRVTNNAAQQISAATWTGLSWNTQVYSKGGLHSTGSNSSRITFAHSTGIYHVGATVTFSSYANAEAPNLRVYVNDSSVAMGQWGGVGGSQADLARVQLTVGGDIRVASTNDYITARVFVAGSTFRILAESTNAALGFWAHRVSS